MIWFLTALAAPPEGLDLDDIQRWEKLTDAALDGPTGCWDFKGGVRVTTTIHTRASFYKRSSVDPSVSMGNFTGRLRDGLWEYFHYTLIEGDSGEKTKASVYPMVGRVQRETVLVNGERAWAEEQLDKNQERADKRAEKTDEPPREVRDPGNMLRSLLDSFDNSTAISTVGWRDSLNAVQLDQDVPIDDSKNPEVAHLVTLFPGGAPFPSRISAVFPRKVETGTWPMKITLVDPQMHLIQIQVRDKVLPMAETASVIVNALGFTIGLEQRFDYQSAVPCSD